MKLLKIISLTMVTAAYLINNASAAQGMQQTETAGMGNRVNDSLKAAIYFHLAEKFLEAGEADSAIANIRMSLDISDVYDFRLLSALNHQLLGSSYDRLSYWEETLFNYLKAADLYKKINMPEREAEIYHITGGRYFEFGVYKRSAVYYEQEFSLYSTGDELKMAAASEAAALSLFYLPDDTLSVRWFNAALHYYEKLNDKPGVTRCLQRIAELNMRLADYETAEGIYKKLLDEYTTAGDHRNEALVYNNTGYLKFRLKDYQNATGDFSAAARISEENGHDAGFLSDIFSNISICYQALGQQQAMMDNFRKALDYATESNDLENKARLSHILAVFNFNKEDNYHAELYCQDCIEAAKKSSATEILQECYQTYSEVLEKGNDFVKALEYYERYLGIRDSLNYEARLREQNEAARQTRYEDLEQRIRLDIADEEITGLALKNIRAESARRENEMKLLLKQQELDRSEKDRLEKNLALEQERYKLTLRNREVLALQQQQRYDSLLIIQKQNETDALDLKNKALEREKQQQELDIKKQKQIKRLAVGTGILMGLVAFMILAGLISTRRKNQKLAESKREIEKINADLEVKNTEVLKQKEIIELKNQSITDSIQYASRIQKAVLPPAGFLTEWGFENFILYLPKDIVSGDFYWGIRKQDKIIIAVADCTGHGVPGAFMSMLGHAFLHEIMNTYETDSSASILNILRDEVINTLKQKGLTGETRDGMDISLCIIDRQKNILDFAGANNPAYVIREKELIKIPADKMPIGIHVAAITPFTGSSIELKKGDLLYLFSDGYADQFGGEKGRKFMYKPFQKLLIEIHGRPMEEQREILLDRFMKWKVDREQVDDVMVVGLRI